MRRTYVSLLDGILLVFRGVWSAVVVSVVVDGLQFSRDPRSEVCANGRQDARTAHVEPCAHLDADWCSGDMQNIAEPTKELNFSDRTRSTKISKLVCNLYIRAPS